MDESQLRVLGSRLRRVRRSQDLTSEGLAKLAGTTRAMISNLEHAHKPKVSFDVLLRIAQVLNVSLDYLAGRKDEDTVAFPSVTTLASTCA
jgi:transcriptional regulator with XRE-family HTH domain